MHAHAPQTAPGPPPPPPGRRSEILTQIDKFWVRVTEGLELNQLWKQFHADALQLVENMKLLREAPIVEEEYRGPVLFSSDAASDMFYDLVAANALGRRPALGRPARTTGAYSSSFKGRVLPEFLSVVDDPTVDTFQGHGLGGSYKVDGEGVPVRDLIGGSDGFRRPGAIISLDPGVMDPKHWAEVRAWSKDLGLHLETGGGAILPKTADARPQSSR